MLDWHLVWKALVLALAAAGFVRLVAKDVQRREKYLLLRQEIEEHEQKLRANRDRMDREADQHGEGGLDGMARTSEAA